MVGLDVVEEGLVVGDFVDVEDADAGEEVLGFGWYFFLIVFTKLDELIDVIIWYQYNLSSG